MIIYTQGTFDLLHAGHINLFKKCRYCFPDATIIVSVLSDEAITEYRGKPPIIGIKDRIKMIKSCKYINKVIVGDHKNTAAEIEKVKADLVVIGSDWAKKDLAAQYRMNKDDLYKKLIYFPYTESISSTEIKERVRNEKV